MLLEGESVGFCVVWGTVLGAFRFSFEDERFGETFGTVLGEEVI